jgi:hypothetical protein
MVSTTLKNQLLMQILFSNRLFWLGFTLGTLGMTVLGLWQLHLLAYFVYGWSAFLSFPFGELDVWFTLAIALLTGFDFGGFIFLVALHRQKCQPVREGFLTLVGATLSALIFGCLSCNLAVLGALGVGLNLLWLTPYLSWLRIVSFAFLLLAAYFVIGKVRNPGCKI